MEQLLMEYSKRHAPDMPETYHMETVRLMMHMIKIENNKKDL